MDFLSLDQEGQMRRPIIAGNWKMNTTVAEAIKLVKEIQPELENYSNIEKIICPPFISLIPVYSLIEGTQTKLGAQNLYFEENGPYTGEISPIMLSGYCQYVILGHSERRQYFYETDSLICQKIKAAVSYGLKPILCVGESLAEFEAGKSGDVVASQLESSLKGVTRADSLVIAYEPVWAIGTGKSASGQQAETIIKMIRAVIEKKYNQNIALNLPVIYGGSVNPANITEFVSQPDIDGALVGGSSLKAQDFISIIKQTSEIINTG
jgi:triosephosphate isomerase (TIM)